MVLRWYVSIGIVDRRLKEAGFETLVVKEGMAELIVPKLDYYRVSPNEYVPSKAPVFYNPLMKENRDLTVAVASLVRKENSHKLVFGDSMAGVGVRAIRILIESRWDEAYVNDRSERAFQTIVLNIERNRLIEKAYPFRMDANLFHAEHSSKGIKFDMLDIDPFGTPIRFLDTGVQAVKHNGLISVTATDAANLFGVQRRAAKILYGVNVLKTGFMRELGIRVLLKALAESAARNERGIEPIVSIANRHYVKIIAKVLRGRKHAFKTVSLLKFLKVKKFGGFYEPDGLVDPEDVCVEDSCILIGPLYAGSVFSKSWVGKIVNEIVGSNWLDKKIFNILNSLLSDDQDIVGGFDLVGLASSLKTSTPSRSVIIEKLLERGFQACRSSLDGNCVRTNARLEDLISIVKSL
jgi:tRNA (guanine26-N2/guanine27-N2)-dimethyltransferase